MTGSKLVAAQAVIWTATMIGVVTSAAAGTDAVARIAGPGMLWFDVVGVIFGVRASRAPGIDRPTRRFSWVMTAALFLTLGVSLTFVATGTKAFPQVGDVLHLAVMLLLVVALVLAPVRTMARREAWKTLLDAGTVVLGAWMLLWYLVVGPSLETSQVSAGLVLAAACYPVADLLVLFGLARVLLRGTGQISRRALAMIGGASVAILIGDVRLGYSQAHVEVFERTAFDFGAWLTCHFMLACAGIELWRQAVRPVAVVDPGRRGVGGKLPFLGIGLGYGLLAAAALRESRVFPWAGLVLGGAGITGLVVLRQLVVQEEITETAETDPLTGLANRARLHDELSRALRRSARAGRSVAVLLVDLNGFKRINDTLGHQVGDGFLVAVATAMRGAVRNSDLVGRLGGDEFAVLVRPVDGEADAAAVAERVSQAITGPFIVEGRPMSAAASIGLAVSEAGELTPDGLLHRADTAMYDLKRRGSGWQAWRPGPSAAMTAEDPPARRDPDQSRTAGGHDDARR
ncbi:GGDEF domain-containing protein [Actinoplanes philippinensis]|uniref:GGDEF domain-containing protein n=1 Tax=Actinoplanes philippinensis TaxID=35752 RepID=UPI0034047BA6